jgi:hypothetical protein
MHELAASTVRETHRCRPIRALGLGSVPGCTRPAADLHHVVFASRGGPDDAWNRTPLCRRLHHRGVHAGRMRIRGRADDVLSFHFGPRPAEEALAKWRRIESGRPRRVGSPFFDISNGAEPAPPVAAGPAGSGAIPSA